MSYQRLRIALVLVYLIISALLSPASVAIATHRYNRHHHHHHYHHYHHHPRFSSSLAAYVDAMFVLSPFCSSPFADRSSRNEYLFCALAMGVIRSRMKSIFMNKAFNSRSDGDETNIEVPADTVVDSGSKPLSRCFPSRPLSQGDVRARVHASIAREAINSLAEGD